MKVTIMFYRVCFRIAQIIFGIFLWPKVTGRENIPEGAALVCANHSSVIDPILMAFALGIDNPIRVIAKAELFKVPVLSVFIKKLGAIKVDRGILDVTSTKVTLNYLKNSEKVAIFPEGTRSAKDDAVPAKSGAVKLADHAKVPLLPVYIPRKKPKFRKFPIVIGRPYILEHTDEKRTSAEYTVLADAMMKSIKELDPALSVQSAGLR